MTRWLVYPLLYCFLVTVNGQSDGSLPEEICPCQAEDSCQGDRHIFGRDPLDIQKFGLRSPCASFGDFPCCPADPPPPKQIKLTAKDLEGFSPAELAQFGLTNDGTIGSSSLPLDEQQDQLSQTQQTQQPIDITQPGAASLAPAGVAVPTDSGQNNVNQQAFPAERKATMVQPLQQQPAYQQQRTYQQQPLPVYRVPARPAYPFMYPIPMNRYHSRPQMYQPVQRYFPMYRAVRPYARI